MTGESKACARGGRHDPPPSPRLQSSSSEEPWLLALTWGLTFSRWVVSTVVPSVTGPASAFFRLSFTCTMLSSRSTRLLSSTLHCSSISFSFCSRLARTPLSRREKNFFLRFYLFSFRMGKRKEKERERNTHVWLPLACPQPGTWPTTQACALTGNRTGDPLVSSRCSIH